MEKLLGNCQSVTVEARTHFKVIKDFPCFGLQTSSITVVSFETLTDKISRAFSISHEKRTDIGFSSLYPVACYA